MTNMNEMRAMQDKRIERARARYELAHHVMGTIFLDIERNQTPCQMV